MYSYQRNITSGSTKNEVDLKQSHQGDILVGDYSHLARLAKSSLIAQKNTDSLPIQKNGYQTGSGNNLSSSSQLNQNLNLNKNFINKDEVVISIEGFRFQPSSLYVHTGTKLIWQVKQNKPQYNTLYDSTGPRFFIVSIPQLEVESPLIHENESYSYVIDQLGSFDMICPNYTRMKGALVVVDKTTTLADLTRELQPKYFMDHVDEFKYSSQGLNNTFQAQQSQGNSQSAQTQAYQQPLLETPLHLLGSMFENNIKNSQIFNPLTAYYGSENNFNSQSNHLINSLSSNNLSHNSNQTSSHPNLQKNQLYYQMSSSAILSTKEQKNDSQFITEILRKNSNDKLSLSNSPSLSVFQLNQEVIEKSSQENLKQIQSLKQEKILTKIIDSSKQETAESEKIAKQFLQELQDEQNNQPNKKKNAHYLQLYKDDFQEEGDEEEEDLDQKDQMKKKKKDNGIKRIQNLSMHSDTKQESYKQNINNQSAESSHSNKKVIDEGKQAIKFQKSSSQHTIEKNKEEKREVQIFKKEKDSVNSVEQTLLTPKRKSAQKKEIQTLKNQKQQFKKASNSNSCNSSNSSMQVSSQQQIPPIKEEDNDKDLKQNLQVIQKIKKQQIEVPYQQKNDDAQTPTCCASSSTITTNATVLAIEERQSSKIQEEQTNKNKHISQFLQQNKQVKQIKKLNVGSQNQANDSPTAALKEQNNQKDGYNSDYDCGQDEGEEEEEDRIGTEKRKKTLFLNQGGNAASSLYFKGHNFQFFRKQHGNQYGCVANEDDEYDDDDEEEYDCNTIISEEDASAYTSKENSLLFRRNNSSSNLHTSGSGMIGSNINPNNSFTASQTLNKRFTKRIRRNYRKKPKIGGLSESYLKSPAQSILTTAESSKYSDTTKQLSQKGDFELEGSDMHERGGLLFQHKYSQKRRASTDQTIQESRYHNNNEDSDTRSIKSLKNEPNITNSSNINNNTNSTNGCGGSAYGCQNSSCNGQNNINYQNPYDCCNESDNESECVDLFSNYNQKYIKRCNYSQSCCQHQNNNPNIFDFLKQQSKMQFLNLTETYQSKDINKKRLKNKKYMPNGSSSNQSGGSLEDLSENREESKSFSSQNTNNAFNQSLADQSQKKQKLIEGYNSIPSAISNEVTQIQKVLALTNEKNEEIQEQISFVKSFLEQRYEIESWLLSTGGCEDLGEIEDY